MDRVRWGIIGIGGIAGRRTAPEMVKSSLSAELVAVMDVDAERARLHAERLGVEHWYADERALLADENVEAVYIATPVHLHLAQVRAAANAGRHILCEKPLGLDPREASEMVSLCRQARVTLGVAFMMRFHALHRKAAEMIRRGDIGRPVFARAQLSCWYPEVAGAWRQVPHLGGGGSLVDMGSHCIDLLEMLLGSPVREVSAFQGTLAHPYSVEDTSVAVLRFANGALATVDNCFSVPDASSRNRLEVYGTGGSLLAEGTIGQESSGSMTACIAPQDGYEAQQSRSGLTAGVQEVEAEPTSLYAAEMDHFSECLRAGSVPEIVGDLGLRNARILAACYESAREKRAVAVE